MQALLRGMHDGDIRTRVLSRTQNDELTALPEVVDYVAAEEASSASFSGMSSASTIAGTKSSYKQLHSGQKEEPEQHICRFCGRKHQGDSSPESRQHHCKAYDKKCRKCGKMHHLANVCKSSPKSAAVIVPMTTQSDPMNGAITSTSHSSAAFYAMQTDPPTKSEHLQPYLAALSADGPVTTIPLPHFVHTVHAGWLARAAQPSPTLPLTVSLDKGAYSTVSLPMPTTLLKTPRVKSLTCCADSGAQLTTVPMSIVHTGTPQTTTLLSLPHCHKFQHGHRSFSGSAGGHLFGVFWDQPLWQTVYCGSKFNSAAQSNYPPIEGEAAALVLGLEKCSQFILGHPNLLVAVDHKPLIKIFGSSTMEDISNPRLFRLKQKALRYRFTPCYVSGKKMLCLTPSLAGQTAPNNRMMLVTWALPTPTTWVPLTGCPRQLLQPTLQPACTWTPRGSSWESLCLSLPPSIIHQRHCWPAWRSHCYRQLHGTC